jgi:hypothetical protein
VRAAERDILWLPRRKILFAHRGRVLAYRVSGDNVLTAEVLHKHRSSGGTGLPKVEEGKYVQGYPILPMQNQLIELVDTFLPRANEVK